MAKVKLSHSEEVLRFIAVLPADIQPVVVYLRQVMLAIDVEIAEHIKWNSPAFYFNGAMKSFDAKEYKRDILVMNLRKNQVLCVLPTGTVIQENTSLLEGKYTDGRRMITFKNLEDLKNKEAAFIATIKEWLQKVERE